MHIQLEGRVILPGSLFKTLFVQEAFCNYIKCNAIKANGKKNGARCCIRYLIEVMLQ